MKKEILILIIIFTISNLTFAQDTKSRPFQGPYLGVSLGSQNIFGGAFLDDLDVLAQKSGFVLDILGGYRLQLLDERLVVGAEYLYGFTDGDLTYRDPRYGFKIDYQNDRQIGIAMNLGYAFGVERNYHAFIVIGQCRRKFEIDFMDNGGVIYNQKDEQNFERYGLGFEAKSFEKISLRISAAKISVDYGELELTQNVEDRFDFNAAVIFQF